MSDRWLGIILLAAGVLIWRIWYPVAVKAITHTKASPKRLYLTIRVIAAVFGVIGGWKLHQDMEGALSRDQMFLGWPLAILGAALLVWYYMELISTKSKNPFKRIALREGSWKGHLGWTAVIVATIPLLHLYGI